MTISSTTVRKSYAGDGSTVAFDTSPMVFFLSTDLVVKAIVTATGAETTLTETTDYTVTGGAGTTGTVTMVAVGDPPVQYGPPAVGVTLLIQRVVPLTQAVDLVNNSANDAETMEDTLDKLTMITQQLDEEKGRSLRIPPSETGTAALTVLPFDRANKFLSFDASKNVTVSATTDTPVSAFATTLLDDTTAGAALTTLGVSTFAKTILDDTAAGGVLTTLGVSSFAQTVLDDANAGTALTTLGVSAAAQTILDDASVAAIRATLDVPSNGEAVLDSIIDAAGDMLIGTAADTIARLAIGAAGTRLVSDGTTAAWSAAWFKMGSFTRDVSAVDASIAYTGVGFKPKALILFANIAGVPGAFSVGFYDGTTQGYVWSDHVVTAGSFNNGAAAAIFFRPAGDNSQNTTGAVTSFDTDGFTISWTKSASSTGTATVKYLALR